MGLECPLIQLNLRHLACPMTLLNQHLPACLVNPHLPVCLVNPHLPACLVNPHLPVCLVNPHLPVCLVNQPQQACLSQVIHLAVHLAVRVAQIALKDPAALLCHQFHLTPVAHLQLLHLAPLAVPN